MKQRCRVCNRSVQPGERHPVLRMPLCMSEPSCRAVYPWTTLEAAATLLGCPPDIPGRAGTRHAVRGKTEHASPQALRALQLLHALPEPAFSVRKPWRKGRERRTRLVLKSSVDAVASVFLWAAPAAGWRQGRAAAEEEGVAALGRLTLGEEEAECAVCFDEKKPGRRAGWRRTGCCGKRELCEQCFRRGFESCPFCRAEWGGAAAEGAAAWL